MKGKPWSVEDENRLKQMLQADKSVRVIAKAMGKTRDCIRKKIARLGLEVVVHAEKSGGTTTTSTSLVLPEELPSVEEALKLLAAISGLSGTVLGIFVGKKACRKVSLGALTRKSNLSRCCRLANLLGLSRKYWGRRVIVFA